MFNLGVGCRRISEDERGALKGSDDYWELKELHQSVGVVAIQSDKREDIIDRELQLCDQELLANVLRFCKVHRNRIQKIQVRRGGEWIRVVFFAARVGLLKELEDFIYTVDRKHFGFECRQHLFKELKRTYDFYLEHYVQEPKGEVSYDEFSKAVDEILKIHGITEISELVGYKKGGYGDLGFFTSFTGRIRKAIGKHPVVQGYLLRKDTDLPGGDEQVITELEREVLSLLPDRQFRLRWLNSSYSLSRATENGRASEILGNGLIPADSEVVIVGLHKKVKSLRLSNPDVYNNVHVLKHADRGVCDFGRRLKEIAKGGGGVELAQGVNYVLLKGSYVCKRWNVSHAHLYVGVIVKEGDSAKVVSVIGVDSWTNRHFQATEQELLDIAFEDGECVKIIWANNDIQDHGGDGSCVYYTLNHMKAFLKMLPECKKDLDAYFLAGRLGREYALGELIKQNMRAQMPNFYESSEKPQAIKHSQNGICLIVALNLVLACLLSFSWEIVHLDQKQFSLNETLLLLVETAVMVLCLLYLLCVSYVLFERNFFSYAGGFKETVFEKKPWEVEGRPNEGRRAETLRLKWKVDRTILKFLLGKKDFNA